jgi:hypothetical protein
LPALRALGTAFAQAVLACVLISSLLAHPANAQFSDVAAQRRAPATATSPASPSAKPSPASSPSAASSRSAAPGGRQETAGRSTGLAGGVAAGLATSALDSLFETIGEAAVWAFAKVVGWVDTTSSPDVRQPWFSEVYARTYWLSATIALVALVWALTAGALRNGVTGMVGVIPRVLFVVLGLAVAVPLVQALLEFTDWLSAEVGGQASQNMHEMSTALGTVLVGDAGAAGATVHSGGAPGFVLAIVALIIVVGSLLVWLQLIFRTAVIYLLLAAAAFPAAMSINRTSVGPIRKILAWIVAMAFAKPVIVLALWIGSAPFAADSRADVAAVLTGAGIMVTAVFAPWALFKLFDFAGDQVTSTISASAHPSQLRTHVEQPVTTYRRTANAVQERATAVREHGVASFSPTRSRAAAAAQAVVAGTTAATGIAAVRAATGHARRTAVTTERPPRAAATTEPGATPGQSPKATSAGEATTGAPRIARPPAPPADTGGDRPPPSISQRPPVDPTGAHDDE